MRGGLPAPLCHGFWIRGRSEIHSVRSKLSTMVIRKSYLRRRAEGGPGSRVAENPQPRDGRSLLGTITELFHTRRRASRSELADLPFPDLLSKKPKMFPDTDVLLNLLELAFLGRASAGEIDRDLNAMRAGHSDWVAEHFVDDLFLAEVVKGCLTVSVGEQTFRLHQHFLENVLASPPTDIETVRFRQDILRELEEEPVLCATEGLLSRIYRLLTLLRASRDDARLEPVRFRFDVLEAFRTVVVQMDDGFSGTTSGLARLHGSVTLSGIQRPSSASWLCSITTRAWPLSNSRPLSEPTAGSATSRSGASRSGERTPSSAVLSGDGWTGSAFSITVTACGPAEMVERLLMGVFQENIPALARAVQVVCHLEFYMAARTLAENARSGGLERLPAGNRQRMRSSGSRGSSTRCSSAMRSARYQPISPSSPDSPVTLVTGPNSGGKTRLLQALGIAQVLAQSGFYVPCSPEDIFAS